MSKEYKNRWTSELVNPGITLEEYELNKCLLNNTPPFTLELLKDAELTKELPKHPVFTIRKTRKK